MMAQMEPFKESLGGTLFRPWPDPLPETLSLPDLIRQAGKPGRGPQGPSKRRPWLQF